MVSEGSPRTLQVLQGVRALVAGALQVLRNARALVAGALQVLRNARTLVAGALQVLQGVRALVAGALHGFQLPGKPNLIYLKDSLWNKKTYLWRHNYPYD